MLVTLTWANLVMLVSSRELTWSCWWAHVSQAPPVICKIKTVVKQRSVRGGWWWPSGSPDYWSASHQLISQHTNSLHFYQIFQIFSNFYTKYQEDKYKTTKYSENIFDSCHLEELNLKLRSVSDFILRFYPKKIPSALQKSLPWSYHLPVDALYIVLNCIIIRR